MLVSCDPERIELPADVQKVTNDLDRGGLIHVNELTFNFAILCWKTFKEIHGSLYLRRKFHTYYNQRSLFCAILQIVATEKLVDFSGVYCNHGHNTFDSFCFRFFNCMSKNFVRSPCDREDDAISRKRKIAKLKGQSSI